MASGFFLSRIFSSQWSQVSGLLPSVGARTISTSLSCMFRATPCLMAEPLKKKRRIDPAVLKAREDRRKRKIEKEIRRLQKVEKMLKPLEEATVPYHLIKQKEIYERNFKTDPDIEEERIILFKEYSKVKCEEKMKDAVLLDRIVYSQQRALDELKAESEELYNAAVKMDPNFLPFTFKGPAVTPSIESYAKPDGEYIDISRNWNIKQT